MIPKLIKKMSMMHTTGNNENKTQSENSGLHTDILLLCTMPLPNIKCRSKLSLMKFKFTK